MNEVELTDIKEIALIDRVNEVYVREGMKKVTMDDMAKKLNVSKKTLYKYVRNRKELVLKATCLHVQKERLQVIKIQEKNLDPIVEQYELSKFVVETISKVNPIVHYDLENYFSEAWDYLNQYFNGFVFESIYKNIVRGQVEGIYRKNFKPDIVAMFFASRIDLIFDGELFPAERVSFKDVYIEYLLYHLNSIVTNKGKGTLNELDFKDL